MPPTTRSASRQDDNTKSSTSKSNSRTDMHSNEYASDEEQINEDVDELDIGEKDEFAPPQKLPASNLRFDKRLIIAEETMFSSTSPGVFPLRHPTFSGTAYYHFAGNGEIYELVRFQDGKRSLFYGDTIIENGNITLMCPCHPMFLALGYVQKNANNKFISLDILLEDDKYPANELLATNSKLIICLKLIADYREIDDEVYYKFNEAKMLDWLAGRFSLIKDVMAKNEFVSGRLKNDDAAFDRYVFGFLTDLIAAPLVPKLKAYLQIKEVEKESNGDVDQTYKRRQTLQDAGNNDFSPKVEPQKKKQRVSTSAKKLQEASKGTASLRIFFTAAPAKSNENGS